MFFGRSHALLVSFTRHGSERWTAGQSAQNRLGGSYSGHRELREHLARLLDAVCEQKIELFAIIQENIKAIRQLDATAELTDYRKMKVCFAAQMFGAGKTMLGRNLVTQLKKADSELQAT